MPTVRKHQRTVSPGKTTTVREHERQAGGGTSPYAREGDDIYEVRPDGSATRLEPPDWWASQGRAGDDDEHWAAADGEAPAEPLTAERPSDRERYRDPAMRKLLGIDTPGGAERFDRMMRERESGYEGPLDQDGCRQEPAPDPGRDRDPAFDRMAGTMREWRSRPAPLPRPEAPRSPQMEKLLGCDTPEGRERWDRLRAYRDAGYEGPLDSEGRIPDPDDPANFKALHALAGMGGS